MSAKGVDYLAPRHAVGKLEFRALAIDHILVLHLAQIRTHSMNSQNKTLSVHRGLGERLYNR